jgi:hypothetical protein
MRASDEQTGSLFSFVNLEERAPARYPLRKIRKISNDAFAPLDGEFQVTLTRRPPIDFRTVAGAVRAALLMNGWKALGSMRWCMARASSVGRRRR